MLVGRCCSHPVATCNAFRALREIGNITTNCAMVYFPNLNCIKHIPPQIKTKNIKVYNLVPIACGSYQGGNSWGWGRFGGCPPQCCSIAVLPGNFNHFKDMLVGENKLTPPQPRNTEDTALVLVFDSESFW